MWRYVFYFRSQIAHDDCLCSKVEFIVHYTDIRGLVFAVCFYDTTYSSTMLCTMYLNEQQEHTPASWWMQIGADTIYALTRNPSRIVVTTWQLLGTTNHSLTRATLSRMTCTSRNWMRLLAGWKLRDIPEHGDSCEDFPSTMCIPSVTGARILEEMAVRLFVYVCTSTLSIYLFFSFENGDLS